MKNEQAEAEYLNSIAEIAKLGDEQIRKGHAQVLLDEISSLVIAACVHVGTDETRGLLKLLDAWVTAPETAKLIEAYRTRYEVQVEIARMTAP